MKKTKKTWKKKKANKKKVIKKAKKRILTPAQKAVKRYNERLAAYTTKYNIDTKDIERRLSSLSGISIGSGQRTVNGKKVDVVRINMSKNADADKIEELNRAIPTITKLASGSIAAHSKGLSADEKADTMALELQAKIKIQNMFDEIKNKYYDDIDPEIMDEVEELFDELRGFGQDLQAGKYSYQEAADILSDIIARAEAGIQSVRGK